MEVGLAWQHSGGKCLIESPPAPATIPNLSLALALSKATGTEAVLSVAIC